MNERLLGASEFLFYLWVGVRRVPPQNLTGGGVDSRKRLRGALAGCAHNVSVAMKAQDQEQTRCRQWGKVGWRPMAQLRSRNAFVASSNLMGWL